MLKRLTVISIITAIILPYAARIGILIDYNLHHTTIVEEMCRFRGQADNDCQGACYVSNRFQMLRETEEPSPAPPSLKIADLLATPDQNKVEFPTICIKDGTTKYIPFLNRPYQSPFLSDDLKPPQGSLLFI